MPPAWMPEEDLRRALRILSRAEAARLMDYGPPLGLLPLRQLIARRLREASVYCEIHPFNKVTDAFLADFAPKAVILSGGPASVFAEGAPMPPLRSGRQSRPCVAGRFWP